MNAIELLKEDHRETLELLERLETLEDEMDAEDDGIEVLPTELFNQLKAALTLHTQLEERIFYPALRAFAETREMIPEALAEHQAVDELLEEMAQLSPHEEEFQNKLEELREQVEHHIEEEEDEMFPKAEELCGQQRLDELGQQLQQMKQQRSQAATTRRP
ncbi:MAG: hemerythrin domain-containing protein [Acidobacteria bacterium]|nr:hemerythrin domain-containing protein [Acidobacteriota bacterium]